MKLWHGMLHGMILATILSTFSPIFASGSSDQESRKALSLIDRMAAVYASVNDYVVMFHKQERIDGKLLPQSTIFLKFQKPLKVYMKWLKGPHEGREALYVAGENNDKLLAHQGGLLKCLTLSLEPQGLTAMKNNRHPITEVGFGFLIDRLSREIRTAVAHNELKVTRMSEEFLDGRRILVVEVRVTPRENRKYYAARMTLSIDENLMLPAEVAFYDAAGSLFENYAYTDVRLNPGLTAGDFSRDNPAYGF